VLLDFGEEQIFGFLDGVADSLEGRAGTWVIYQAGSRQPIIFEKLNPVEFPTASLVQVFLLQL